MPSDLSYTDSEIVAALIARGTERERMINYLVNKHTGYIYTFQKKFHFGLQESKDLYADAIVSLSSQVERGDFRFESKLSTYLYKILDNKCKRHLEMKKEKIEFHVDELPNMSGQAKSMLQELIHKDEMNWINGLMDQLGEVCRKILLDSDYYGYSLAEVAKRIDYKSAASVSSKKYKCLEQLRKLIGKYRAVEKK